MRLRKGKATEWEIMKKMYGGELDFWEAAKNERHGRQRLKALNAWDGETKDGFVLCRVTYEAAMKESEPT